MPQVVLGLSQACAEHDFQILISPLEPQDHGGYSRLIHEKHVDGIVLSGPRMDDDELLQLCCEGTPVLLMGQLPETTIPFVDINAVDGANKAVQHLIALGHRRIAMITNAPFEYTSAQQRHSGYKQALESCRNPLQPGSGPARVHTPRQVDAQQ